MDNLCIYWVRRDFRFRNNSAFYKALKYSTSEQIPLILIYILDEQILNNSKVNVGYPRRKILAKILANFNKKLINFNYDFRIYCGQTEEIFNKLNSNFNLVVFANEDIEPYARIRDTKIKTTLEKLGSVIKLYSDSLNIDRKTRSQTGSLYTVFTPFREKVLPEFLALGDIPERVVSSATIISSNLESKLNDIELAENIQKLTDLDEDSIYNKIKTNWQFSVSGDNEEFTINLENILPKPDLDNYELDEEKIYANTVGFIVKSLPSYHDSRNSLEMDTQGTSTSKLSLALKWGLISPITIISEVQKYSGDLSFLIDKRTRDQQIGVFTFISELIWREFYKYILFHFPSVLDLEFQEKFQNSINWVDFENAKIRFLAWIKGQTGYHLVDAAMNQIAKTGWMHNRTRMVVASVLTKNLGVDWRWGQEYFRAILVDLDESANNGGWQWSASVGVDPKPIRIFNPYLQAKNYDQNGVYQKFWLPNDYDVWQPIVEHSLAREKALKRYGLKGG